MLPADRRVKAYAISIIAALTLTPHAHAMEKSKHHERNTKVVTALKNAGSDFRRLHNIEHHLYCYTEADFRLATASTPDIFSIEKQAVEIERIAEKANADYDGWGTEVEQ